MAKSNRDNFSSAVVRKLAERAGYLCSNPGCNRSTIGPSLVNDNLSIKHGVGAHICSAASNGPRYDMSQSSAQRASIKNGIWLCGSCSIMIDKNNGVDYLAPLLRKWKKDHEYMMKESLEGIRRVVVKLVDNTLNDKPLAIKLVKFLENRGVLFMPIDQEVSSFVFDSVKEIRNFLLAIQANLDEESTLSVTIDSINNGCRHFMNTTNYGMSNVEIASGLYSLRKLVGINLTDIEKTYRIKVHGKLANLIII